jgi:hypothetical protein
VVPAAAAVLGVCVLLKAIRVYLGLAGASAGTSASTATERNARVQSKEWSQKRRITSCTEEELLRLHLPCCCWCEEQQHSCKNPRSLSASPPIPISPGLVKPCTVPLRLCRRRSAIPRPPKKPTPSDNKSFCNKHMSRRFSRNSLLQLQLPKN